MSCEAEMRRIRELESLYATAQRTHDPRDWTRYHLALKRAAEDFQVEYRPVEDVVLVSVDGPDQRLRAVS